VAELRMILDIALGAPEGGRVVPKLPRGRAEQAAVGDAIRVGGRVGVEVAASDREREAGAERHDTAGLPAAENGVSYTAQSLEERHIPDIVHDHVVSYIEPIASAILAAVIGILVGGIDTAGGIVTAVALTKSFAVGVGEPGGEPMGVAFLDLELERVIVGVGEAVQVPDVAEQPRHVGLATADVSLEGPADVEVGVDG